MEKTDQDRLAYWLLKDVNKAIRDFNMIQDRDRIAVAVSGGKDSLSLLRLLDVRRASSREKYSLFVIHVIGDSRGPVGLKNTGLIDWLAANSYEYTIEPMIIPDGETLPMTCQRCTWNRRRTIFEVAYKNGCNKIAFGHHADDLAQTTLLNLISNGRIETMAPKVAYFNGAFHIIRPMCYLSEKAIRRFTRALSFPPSPMDCPQKERSHRQRVEEMIHEAEKWCKNIRTNLLRAGLKGVDSP